MTVFLFFGMCSSQTNIISMSRRIVVRQFSMHSSSDPGHFDILPDNIRPWELCIHRVKVLPEVVSGGGMCCLGNWCTIR